MIVRCEICGREAEERWLSVPSFVGRYEVSDFGRVLSLARTVPRKDACDLLVPARFLKPGLSAHGYPLVSLWKSNKGTTKLVYRLVLHAFKGPLPQGKESRHLDGNRVHSCLTNLAYGTHKDNEDDRRLHGTMCEGETHGSARLTEANVREIRAGVAAGEMQKTYAKKFGVNYVTVGDVVNRRTWRHVE